jgi:hypothetical protein
MAGLCLLDVVPSLHLELVILLLKKPARGCFRAAASQVDVAGTRVLSRFSLADPGPGESSYDTIDEHERQIRERLDFWSPWVGNLCVSRTGSLCVEHFVDMWRSLLGGSRNAEDDAGDPWIEIHGCSSEDILYSVQDGSEWVPALVRWRVLSQ